MFVSAIQHAMGFTRPVVLSRYFYDGSVECGLAAFVVLNNDGWILTAAHVFEAELAFPEHLKQISKFEAAPKKGKGQLKKDPKWLKDHSYWWSGEGIQAKDIQAYFDLDIALARLEPWSSGGAAELPVFRDITGTLPPGTSVCRLGFPFHDLGATYVPGTGFALAQGSLPAPFFPIEGIVTRNLLVGKTADGKYDMKLLETSSPGLRGQSGGPIFDVEGRVVGIQTKTNHLELGFSPKAKSGKTEHQFLNVGLGVHIDVLRQFLADQGVKVALG